MNPSKIAEGRKWCGGVQFEAGPEGGEQHAYVAMVGGGEASKQKKVATGYERCVRRVDNGPGIIHLLDMFRLVIHYPALPSS